jgi:hypothetical protein
MRKSAGSKARMEKSEPARQSCVKITSAATSAETPAAGLSTADEHTAPEVLLQLNHALGRLHVADVHKTERAWPHGRRRLRGLLAGRQRVEGGGKTSGVGAARARGLNNVPLGAAARRGLRRQRGRGRRQGSRSLYTRGPAKRRSALGRRGARLTARPLAVPGCMLCVIAANALGGVWAFRRDMVRLTTVVAQAMELGRDAASCATRRRLGRGARPPLTVATLGRAGGRHVWRFRWVSHGPPPSAPAGGASRHAGARLLEPAPASHPLDPRPSPAGVKTIKRRGAAEAAPLRSQSFHRSRSRIGPHG